MNDQEENPYAAPQSLSDGRAWVSLRLYVRMMMAAGSMGLVACVITVFGIVVIASVDSNQPPAAVLYLGIVAATIVGAVAFIIIAWRRVQPWVFASDD